MSGVWINRANGQTVTVPRMRVQQQGQTLSWSSGWNAVWTFDRGHRTMSGEWTNAQTGQHARAYGMFVRQDGDQIIVARPGLGNVGTISSEAGRCRAR